MIQLYFLFHFDITWLNSGSLTQREGFKKGRHYLITAGRMPFGRLTSCLVGLIVSAVKWMRKTENIRIPVWFWETAVLRENLPLGPFKRTLDLPTEQVFSNTFIKY